MKEAIGQELGESDSPIETLNSFVAFVPSDEARRDFPNMLQRLLDRPEGKYQECGFCGFENRLSQSKRLNATCLFSGVELERIVCNNCGGIFGPVQLINCAPVELGALYKCLYRFYREGFSVPYQEKTFYLMNPSRRRTYLNFACGDWVKGCERLRSIGWDVWGFEPFQESESNTIFTCRESLDEKLFDGVMSHNYIEHVQDPLSFFRQIRGLLKPEAVMAHSSACYDYIYEISPFHLFFYCGESVTHLAERSGFRLISEHRVDQDFPGHQYVCCVFQACDHEQET